jgi:hypothetical protein
MYGYCMPRSFHVAALAALALMLAGSLAVAADGVVGSKVDLTLRGRVKFDANYDTGNLRGFTDYAAYLATENDAEFNFNPRDTRFGFAASGREGDWTYKAVFEMGFYGDNAGNNLIPRMRLGYTEAANTDGFSMRVGQDWIPIAQQNPGTIDFGILSWGGNLWWRVPQITLRQRTGDFEVLGSAMKHRISTVQERDEGMPWFIGRVAWFGVLGDKSMLAVGGGYHSVTVDGDDYAPWIVAGELRVPLGDKIFLNGEYYTGEGIGREFVHYGFDYNAAHPDGATAIRSRGGFASLAFKPQADVAFNAGYGMDHPCSDDMLGLAVVPYLKNNVLFGNVKKQITANYGVGVEIMHFETETATTTLQGERFTYSCWFIF